ncbi:MAG: sulfite exporter TauE/SafE family protein [Gammaproteobacteria bacterium]
MTSLSFITILVAGLVIGLLLGLTGGGGSILTVPLLVYVVGLDAKVAIATSLLVVGLASLAALLPHSRAGHVYWHTGFVFGGAGMAGAYSGGWVARYIPDAVLLLFFAAIMLASGVAMLRRRPLLPIPEDVPATIKRSWVRIVGDGFVVGIVTGLVGAGGGFLVVPALALLGGLPMHAAIGTSLLVIAMKSFAGLAGYISHVPIDGISAFIVGLLAIAGTALGSRLTRVLSGAQLRSGFGLFVLIVAALLLAIEGGSLLADLYQIDRRLSSAVVLGIECIIALALIVRRVTGASQVHPLH